MPRHLISLGGTQIVQMFVGKTSVPRWFSSIVCLMTFFVCCVFCLLNGSFIVAELEACLMCFKNHFTYIVKSVVLTLTQPAA